MCVKINGQEIPRNTLVFIFLAPSGTAHASGEAVSENDRNVVTKILDRLNENERIEFELETHDLRRLHGAGFIQNIDCRTGQRRVKASKILVQIAKSAQTLIDAQVFSCCLLLSHNIKAL
jgi:hypothetical protein